MGRAVLASLGEPFSVGAAFVGPTNPRLGESLRAAGLAPSDVVLRGPEGIRRGLADCDVLVSFATPAADAAFAPVAAELGLPMVVGTTGHSPAERATLVAASERVPIVLAPNFSVGVAVLHELLGDLGALGAGFDASIVEVHHARKRDAPSGTALELSETLRRALARSDAAAGPRAIPIASLRVGGVPGEHSVVLAGAHEELRIEHRVFSREAFAAGALRAARWATAPRPPGLYSFRDVIAPTPREVGAS